MAFLIQMQQGFTSSRITHSRIRFWTAAAKRSGDAALERPRHFRVSMSVASKEIKGSLETSETLESGVGAALCHRTPKSDTRVGGWS